MSETSDRIKQGLSQAQDAANGLGSKISAKASDVGQTVRDATGSAVHAAGAKYADLSGKAKGVVGKGKAVVSDWEDDMGSMIEDRPLLAILIAALVGVFVGLLLSNRTEK